ncbi:MAG: T9SS type A sorting domain-containing protein, partial [candidate division Zixibacteria bacterium]|nr:T9SS type A sorting domain-containing protein [candidate division Zixibacteria bacterium]
IEDRTPPTIACPDNVSVQCPGDIPAVDIGSVTVSDDCDPNPAVTHIGDISDNNSCPETITRTYRATDASGNYAECAQIIIIDDTIAPEIICPPDITVACNGSTDPSNTGNASATDNCDSLTTITYSDVTDAGVITRTWVSTDACGNSSQCVQTITVEDNTAPLCNVPNDTTIFQCAPAEVCLPVSAADAEDNLDECVISSGPGTLDAGNWCYTPQGDEIISVTVTCTDSCDEFCEASFEVEFVINSAPTIAVAEDIDTFVCDADDQICFDNSASDPDLPSDDLYFEMPSAPAGATIDQQTGEVCFNPGTAGTFNFTIRVYDNCTEFDEGTVTVTVTENQPPTISANQNEFFFGYCPDADPAERCFNGFTISDPDHSTGELTISKIQGPGTFNQSTGRTCFTPDVVDSSYEFVYEVSDPCGAVDLATIDVNVVVYESCDSITCIDVALGDTACVFNSTYTLAPIMISNYTSSIGGFELLITYDPTAFTFVEALQGEAIADWEYFTFRTGPFGNCGDNCPSGMILIVGIADVNNGPAHPDQSALDPNGVLSYLKFYVTDNRDFGGQAYPLQFFWMDCGNNMFANDMGDTVYIDKRIYDPYGGIRWDEFDDVNFPESERIFGTGATDDCVIGDKTVPIRCIQFFDGYIAICHPDSIDLRGDINMNEIPNEVGDAVLYTNYFIYGPGVFTISMYGQVAASDVNADGKTLTVGDLVYLIRVMSGDAVAVPKLSPYSEETLITMQAKDEGYNIRTSADTDMGALRLSFDVDNAAGEFEVELAEDISSLSIMSDVVENKLNVLIYSFDQHKIPAGENEIVNIKAPEGLQLVSAEASDYEGSQLDIILSKVEVPTEFALSQNYPNPFNPETEIMLSLPEAGDWSLDIYNIRGQLVRQFSGYSDAGTVNVKWDSRDDHGNEVASGIYFYKARVDDRFSQTRKMILLK